MKFQSILTIPLFSFLLFSCSDRNTTIEEIKLQLPWTIQTQFSGPISAKEIGAYKDEGMDVSIIEGGFNINVAAAISRGDVDFGILQPDNLIYFNSKNENDSSDLVAIDVVFKKSMGTFIVRSDSSIYSIPDMRGKKVGIKEGTNLYNEFLALIGQAGMSLNDLTPVPVQWDLGIFVRGDIDVFPGFSINEPYLIEKSGVSIRQISSSSGGLYFYGDVIATSRENLTQNPDIVKKFVAATKKGWAFAINNPKETVSHIIKLNPALDSDHQFFMLKESIKLIHKGQQDINVWKSSIETLEKFGGLEKQKVKASTLYLNL